MNHDQPKQAEGSEELPDGWWHKVYVVVIVTTLLVVAALWWFTEFFS